MVDMGMHGDGYERNRYMLKQRRPKWVVGMKVRKWV